MRADNRLMCVLRDERGFFLTSWASKGFKLLKTGVTAAGRAAGVLPPAQPKPAYVAPVTPSAGPPATSTTSPQPFVSPLEKIKDDLTAQIRKVAEQTGSAAAEAFVKPVLESEAVAKQKRMLYIGGAVVGGLVLVTLIVVLTKKS